MVYDTPPRIWGVFPVRGKKFRSGIDRLVAKYRVFDEHDPSPTVTAFFVKISDTDSQTVKEPKRISVSSGTTINSSEVDDGVWMLEVVAKDFVNNASRVFGDPFRIIESRISNGHGRAP